MFESVQRTTGREYTRTVAWLAAALIFIPAAFLAVRPGYISLSLAFFCSVSCVTIAWISWKRSRLTIPSIAPQNAASK